MRRRRSGAERGAVGSLRSLVERRSRTLIASKRASILKRSEDFVFVTEGKES